MPAPLPQSLRESIVHAHEHAGLSFRKTAAALGVCESTVARVLRRRRALGTVAPLPHRGGNVSPLHGSVAELLHELIARMPDATIAELTHALVQQGNVQTSRSGVVRALRRLGYSRKKSPSSPRSRTVPNCKPAVGRSAKSSL